MVSWRSALCPFTIEFVPDKLDAIRVAVIDGFYAVPRGGVEIGGVLFGTRDNSRISIQDFRKIETEYLTGPSFQLSGKDLAGLRTLLEETEFEDEAVKAVGWFHSHTRSEIHLSNKDMELHREYFPELWQVALVLKPDNLGKVRAGYFFRQKGGLLKGDKCADEFTVEPYFGDKKAAVVAAGAEKPVVLEDPVVVRVPIVTAAPLVMEPVVFSGPVPLESYAARSGMTAPKRIFFVLLALALIAAAGGGYWTATH